MGFVLKIDERDDTMRLADMNWAIQMGFNVYKELTDRNRVGIHFCAISNGVVNI